MRKRRKRVLINMTLFAIAFTLWLMVGYVYGCKSHAQPDQDCIQVCGWWCCFLRDPGAVATLYASLFAILGFWFISVQVEQGHKGLKQTKRSVDAFINVERGRIHFHDITSNLEWPTKTHISFINSGPGDIVLVASGFVVQKLDKLPPNKWVPHIKDVGDLPNGKLFAKDTILRTGFKEGNELSGINTTFDDRLTADEIALVNQEKLFIFIRGFVRYDTMIGTRYDRNFAANWHPAHKKFITTEHPEMNKETETKL